MFFDSWNGIWRVLVVGTLAYAALVLILRVSGKRTLSKLNAFDLVVTVALGSTLATILLTKDVSLVEGVTAMALLVFLQASVAWVSVRSKKWRTLVKSEPRLLAFRGELLQEAMKEERLIPDEIHAVVRSHGHATLAEIEAVVMETDGTISVLTKGPGAEGSPVLAGIKGLGGGPPGSN